MAFLRKKDCQGLVHGLAEDGMDHHLMIARLVAEMLHEERPVVGQGARRGDLAFYQVLRRLGRLVVKAQFAQGVKEAAVAVGLLEPPENPAVGKTGLHPAALDIALPEGAPEAARSRRGYDNGVLCNLPDAPGEAAQKELVAHPRLEDEFLVQLA